MPLIAPHSRAAWREPSRLNRPPASVNATANGNQLIEVGSATATAPGYSASFLVNIDNPANVGATVNPLLTTAPAASTWRTHPMMGSDRRVDMPICTRGNAAVFSPPAR